MLTSLQCTDLPQRLVQYNSGRGGQVEATDLTGRHRDGKAGIRIGLQQLLRQALGLLAENDIITRLEADVKVVAGYFCAEVVKSAGGGRGPQFIQILPVTDIDKLPIIQAGPFQVAVVGGKSKLTHQVQTGTRGCAQTGNITGIRRDFRFDEYDIKWLHGEIV